MLKQIVVEGISYQKNKNCSVKKNNEVSYLGPISECYSKNGHPIVYGGIVSQKLIGIF